MLTFYTTSIRGGMWGVECPVVRTTETYACIAQCDRGQWSEPCELYILRRKSETDFGRYTSYFRTAFESLYQKRDCILFYVCVIIYQDTSILAKRMRVMKVIFCLKILLQIWW